MEEITRFVVLAQSDRFTVTELCEQFGISRKTGCKHLARDAKRRRQSRRHGPRITRIDTDPETTYPC